MAYDAPQSGPVIQTATGNLEGTGELARTGAFTGAGGEDQPDAKPDRLGIHGIWEVLLALLAAATAAVVHQINGDALLGAGLEAYLLLAASLGLAAVGLGWSVRAAVPNLAVGPIALGAAMFFSVQAEGGIGFGVGVTLAAAAAAGVLLSLVVVGLHVPAWAASLALAMGIGAWVTAGRATELPEDLTYRPGDHAVYWFVGFAAVSVLAGMFGLAGPVRRMIGAFRPSGDPSEAPGFGPGLSALTALIGSCLLAALAGVLTALMSRGAVTDPGFALTGLALGAVLIGGTSGYGRRGGVAGTLLGVVLLCLVLRLAAVQNWQIPTLGYAAVAVLVGLLVTRMVETAGRPRSGTSSGSPEWASAEPSALTAPRAPLALTAGAATPAVVRGEVLAGETVVADTMAASRLGGRLG
jgi:ribose/xylose/arabinose/galactoside ABC-type transport system permease subunit